MCDGHCAHAVAGVVAVPPAGRRRSRSPLSLKKDFSGRVEASPSNQIWTGLARPGDPKNFEIAEAVFDPVRWPMRSAPAIEANRKQWARTDVVKLRRRECRSPWTELHRDDLAENWRRAEREEPLATIDPLP